MSSPRPISEHDRAQGELVRSMRQERGYTQEFLCKVLDIARVTYVEIEQGRRRLLAKDAKRLARFYGVTSDDIILDDLKWRSL